jgi:nucleoside-diphosphate-sugar epimerase
MGLTNKTVLITGASGLIGSNLVDTLMRSDCKLVIVMGRNQRKMEDTFERYLSNKGFKIVVHDVSNPFPEDLEPVNLIFHAAGPMERNIVLNHPVDVIKPNIIGTINCMNFAQFQRDRYKVQNRTVIFSSLTVYRNSTDVDFSASEEMTNNADTLDSTSACYSESKRMSEVIAKSYEKQFGLDVVIARFSTVFGYTKNIPDTAFYEFIRKAWNGETLVVNKAGLPRRDNIYMSDAISGLIDVALKGECGEAYNISSNGEHENFVSVDEIAQIISNAVAEIKGESAKEVKVGDGTPCTNRIPGLLVNNMKLKSLGWNLQVSFKEGVKETIQRMMVKPSVVEY